MKFQNATQKKQEKWFNYDFFLSNSLQKSHLLMEMSMFWSYFCTFLKIKLYTAIVEWDQLHFFAQ